MKVFVDWPTVVSTFIQITAPAFCGAFFITTAIFSLSPQPNWVAYATILGMKAAVWGGLGLLFVAAIAVWSFFGAWLRLISLTYRSGRSARAAAAANAERAPPALRS